MASAALASSAFVALTSTSARVASRNAHEWLDSRYSAHSSSVEKPREEAMKETGIVGACARRRARKASARTAGDMTSMRCALILGAIS